MVLGDFGCNILSSILVENMALVGKQEVDVEIKAPADQGFQTRTIHWTVQGRGSRFLRSNRDDVIINLIIN